MPSRPVRTIASVRRVERLLTLEDAREQRLETMGHLLDGRQVDGPSRSLEAVGAAEDVRHVDGRARLGPVEGVADRAEMLAMLGIECGEELPADVGHEPVLPISLEPTDTVREIDPCLGSYPMLIQ